MTRPTLSSLSSPPFWPRALKRTTPAIVVKKVAVIADATADMTLYSPTGLYAGAIPASFVDPQWDLMYLIEIVDRQGNGSRGGACFSLPSCLPVRCYPNATNATPMLDNLT